MPKLTLQQRITRYMGAMGYIPVVPSPSKKYKAFKPTVDKTRIFFVGKSGAVRSAPTGKVTNSFSITEKMMVLVEQWEKEQGYAG